MENKIQSTLATLRDAEQKLTTYCVDKIYCMLLEQEGKEVYINYYNVAGQIDTRTTMGIFKIFVDEDFDVCVKAEEACDEGGNVFEYCIESVCTASEIYDLEQEVEKTIGENAVRKVENKMEEYLSIRDEYKNGRQERDRELDDFTDEFYKLVERHKPILEKLIMGLKIEANIKCTHYKNNEYVVNTKDISIDKSPVIEWYD